MSKTMRIVALVAKAGTVAVLGASAVLGIASTAATAAGKGNSAGNCYGIWFTRDWNQDCGAGGASWTGVDLSIADCPNRPDKTVSAHRSEGDTRSIDGEDCSTSVRNITTWFQ
ncbi:hypothetical protein AB0C27_35815 [Nonomuraea sp. NPDC048882]|uniref:hypothetical protein n=1 Tax=Nonomuraea sp. NPDC048882 TaxID=3154347 RepID=UPI0033D8C127